MTLDLLAALLLAHLVADYPLQDRWMATRKHEDADALLVHILVHGVATSALVALSTDPTLLAAVAVGVIVVSHGVIDLFDLHIRWDQTAHLATLLVIWAVVG